jgi:hypothetical protein
VDDEFPFERRQFLSFENIVKHTSTLAAMRKVATAINCRFFCVINELVAVVDVID